MKSFFDQTVEVQEVGGCTALEPYIQRIRNGEMTRAIVACDTDLTSFVTPQVQEHCNIIR
ncbi:hypothetical protein VISI1226_13643, partial [Vibrio sinaloensis DSM 21326]